MRQERESGQVRSCKQDSGSSWLRERYQESELDTYCHGCLHEEACPVETGKAFQSFLKQPDTVEGLPL